MAMNETDQPIQDEEHIRKLIAALKGSSIAAVWWEFKHGGSASLMNGTEQDTANDRQRVAGGG
jgi:hypothetical protein